MDDLISIIIPVYKVEPYLRKCLDSVTAQTYKNIEIILVDDGSPDGCGAICDEYAAKDSRCRVFHTENRGLSCARNYGISVSRGAWLMFIDSDDWVEPDFCSIPYEAAKRYGADLVMFRFNSFRNGELEEMPCPDLPEGIVSKSDAIDMVYYRGILNYAWNKLYKRELFNGVEYPAGRTYEDVGTTYKLVLASKVTALVNKPLYNYVIARPNSITSTNTKANRADFMEMKDRQMQDLIAWGHPRYIIDEVTAGSALSYLIRVERSGKKINRNGTFYKWRCANVRNARLAGRGEKHVLSKKRLILLHLFRISPALFGLACRVSRKKRTVQSNTANR